MKKREQRGELTTKKEEVKRKRVFTTTLRKSTAGQADTKKGSVKYCL